MTGATLVVERRVEGLPDSIVYSDCWKGYNVLDVSDYNHVRPHSAHGGSQPEYPIAESIFTGRVY
jgi:transposase-like protein